MGSLPEEAEYFPASHHLNILESVLDGSVSAENAIIRSYKHSFNGFAAKLTETEKEKLNSLEGVVSVFPDGKLKLHTTRSWDFTGLTETIQRNKVVESDIIIGVLDTGIWPESESFSDEGFGPAPTKWHGECADSFPCNNKLIGAKNFVSVGVDDSPRDLVGHGTHTASTAAGSIVHGASFFGIADGTARGAVPSSRIAAYKVCDEGGCSDSSILAAFDTAIRDGVDVITISIGAESASEFHVDPIAIGAFHAFQKGILTVNSAGNSGDGLGTTSSVAPWLFSVAASSTDRLIQSNVVLGNGKTIPGFAINSGTLKSGNYPLVYAKDATTDCSGLEASTCNPSCLSSELVKGKIILCDSPSNVADEAISAGALGLIVPLSSTNVSFIFPLPASALSPDDYDVVKSYYAGSKSPVGNIQKTVSVKDANAPTVAKFSSRGPNQVASDILKPDITGPGVDILAAYSPKVPPSASRSFDKRSVNYSIVSGTSMSCPHVAGASAYIKSFHPTWSPSAIKSALMTTALPISPAKNPDAEFAYGAGYFDPVKALNPGLVYESSKVDYVGFLCKLGYDASKIKLIVGSAVTCSKSPSNTTLADLNYPSLSAKVLSNKGFSITFQRTVTNVGKAGSTYKATVTPNPNFKVTILPSTLSFKSLNESQSFSVTVNGGGLTEGDIQSVALTWSDGIHTVRSPIVIYN